MNISLSVGYEGRKEKAMKTTTREIIEELNDLAEYLAVNKEPDNSLNIAFLKGYTTAKLNYLLKVVEEWEEEEP